MRRRRNLADGEIKLARHVFKNALNFSNIRVIEHFMKAGSLDDTAITPFGSIYFPADDFRADYIGSNMYDPIAPAGVSPTAPDRHNDAHWFLHELAHIWQHYVGTRVTLRGFALHMKAAKSGANPYGYGGAPKPDLPDYNIEQQGDIIADYFAWKLGWRTSHFLVLAVADYEAILAKFLADPTYPRAERWIWNARASIRGLDR